MRSNSRTKKLLAMAIAIVFAIGLIGCSVTDESTDEKGSANQSTEESKDKETTADESSNEKKVDTYEAGTYKVGSDIPAGEYVFFANEDEEGYFEVSSSSDGDSDNIIGNDNFTYDDIVTIKEGNYLTLEDAYAIPIDQAGDLDTSGSGMFKVGVHIKAGEYKLICTDEELGGYFEVTKDSSADMDSIVANENFDKNQYVTVKDGQYFKITDAKIVK